jgi:hypothetical protein
LSVTLQVIPLQDLLCLVEEDVVCIMNILVMEEHLVWPADGGGIMLLVISIVVMRILRTMIRNTKIPENIGDVNGDNPDDFDVINEGSLGEVGVPVSSQ